MLRALDYLTKVRGLTPTTIYNFHLGYIDQVGNIYTDVDSGIADLNIDPRFFDSTMFPIYNLYNEVIGVSCRSLQNNPKLPKYINTVYAKGCHLYGLQTTWRDCLASRKVYVVEGNVDTLQMWQSGIKNVVGMLGSNLTYTQMCLLSRFVDEIVLVPDGDNAGEKFLNKIKEALARKHQNMSIKFKLIKLPAGYDPDKFLKENESKALLSLETSMFYSLEDLVKGL